VTEEDNGIFWIDVENFKKAFDFFTICRYNDNYKFTSTKLFGEYGLSKVSVSKSGEYTFSICQKE